MFDKGLFRDMFDLNYDGKMDSFEKAAEFSFFMNMVSEFENESSDNSNTNSTNKNHPVFEEDR